MDVTFGLAFALGVVTFISPCVLPLVPAYVGYMGGHTARAAADGRERAGRFGVLMHGMAFIAGFAVVFTLLGVAAGALGDLLQEILVESNFIRYVGGAFIILFGLHIMGVFRRLYFRLSPAWQQRLQPAYTALYADTRRQYQGDKKLGYLGSAFMGLVFAAGWSPCIGPVLASILAIAAGGSDPVGGGVLLLSFSLGLGVPFLLVAVALDRMTGALRSLQRHMGKIEAFSGVLLVFIGVLMFSGILQQLSVLGGSSSFGYALEECVVGRWLGGEMALDEMGACFEEVDAMFAATASADINAGGAYLVDVQPDGSAVDWARTAGPIKTAAPEGAPVGAEVDSVAPNFETQNLLGMRVTLEDFRGKVVLLNFWATWCLPCRAEMPDLQQAAIDYSDRLVVLPVNLEERPEAILAFAEESGLRLHFLLDQAHKIHNLYNVRGQPVTFLIAPDGTVLVKHIGVLTPEQLEAYLMEMSEVVVDAF